MARKAQPKTTAPNAPNDEPNKTEDKGAFVWVTSAKPRRRAGYRFGPKPTKVYEADLDEEKAKAIRDDLMLKIKKGQD